MEKVYRPFGDTSTPDWLKPITGFVGKPITWVQPANLPPVVVGNRCLNEPQIHGLLDSLNTPFQPQPILKALRQHADQASLDAFVWRLFEMWLAHGAPVKEQWALLAIGWLGGDTCAIQLAKLIRAWPGESQHQRAVIGLECLRDMGTDMALMQLNGIAQKVKYKKLQTKAREFMESIARKRGITPAELEDRIVPDLDLDEKGGRTFDLGPRKFELALDGDLQPMVRDETGKLREDLPKPGAKDDEEKATAAVADWKLLKKQLREVVKLQVIRLEQQMVIGRRWPAKDFSTLLVHHPLMTHLVRRLLWGRYDEHGKLTGLFRVTEDMTLVDESGAAVELAETERIGLVHPLHLGADEKAKWGQVFADYEILPPFPQLGRPVFTLEPEEAEANIITRGSDVAIPGLSVMGVLEQRGWTHGVTGDHGFYDNFSKQFPSADVTAVVLLSEGINVASPQATPDVKLAGCFFLYGLQGPFRDATAPHGPCEPGVKLALVEPVVLSEVLADLAEVVSRGK